MAAKTYANILKYGTQSAYEALATKDASVLYFTDAGKLYKGSLDITNACRVVADTPANPVAGIVYVVKAGTTITTKVWDGTAWTVIGNPVTTTVSSTSTDTEVPTAKAVYTATNAVDTKVGALSSLETTDKTDIVSAINEVSGIANDNATAIGVTPDPEAETPVAGSGIKKDIYDINATINGFGTAVSKDFATVAIGGEGEDTSALPTVEQVKTFVTQEVADLEGAMHFRAAVTPTEGQTDAEAMDAWYAAQTVAARKIPEKGDVFVITTNTKEYIVSDVTADKKAVYKEIGAEGLYVLKTTQIAGNALTGDITAETLRTSLNVEDGAQVNKLEGVQVNGSDLTIDTNKKVNVTVATGTENGTVAVNGTDVAVKGLGSAAYTDADAYDAAGTADTLVGTLSTLSTEAKGNAVAAINEVDAHADAANATADQNTLDIAALSAATTAWGTF